MGINTALSISENQIPKRLTFSMGNEGRKWKKDQKNPHTILLENNRLMTIIFIERVSQIFTQTKGQPNFLGEDKGGLPHHF